ncbi:hypothetical protein EDF65_0245 [Chryseobacterium nakagawai]|nr:hypothetical protein EDF65_0245 [Chryseobacterium nakagawai]
MAQFFTDDGVINLRDLRNLRDSFYSSIVLKVRFTLGVFTFVVGGSL